MRRLLAAILVLPLAACGAGGSDQTLTVLAAASLGPTFTELADRFEAEHPGAEVQLVLGSSTTLAEQAVDGAPGQVLATADERAMKVAEDGNALADSPDAFASNTLALVTPPDNPAGIDSVADLDDPEVSFVVCVASAPCGALTAELLASVGTTGRPASEEVDVKAVLARVTQGEADAGIVYRTDVIAAGDSVHAVELPEAAALATNYYVAPLHQATGDTADLAAEFVTLVLSNAARRVLDDAGFGSVVRE